MRHLLKQWGSEFACAQVTALRGGVWQVELAEKMYILKHRSNRTRVWAEYDLMNWLILHKQPISQLIHTKEQVPWAEYENRMYVLYPYLAGTSGDELVLDNAYAWKIGAGIASLHVDLATYEAAENFPVFDVFKEVASFAWPTVQGYLGGKFRNRLHDLEQGMSRNFINPYESLPRQLIHRDLHPGNLIFNDGNLMGILDFDRVRIGVRLFDLCYFASAVLSQDFATSQNKTGWFSFVQALIDGYISVQPLTPAEGISFLYIVYLIQILFVAHHLDEGNTKLADLDLAMLLWINDQHDFLEPLITKAVAG